MPRRGAGAGRASVQVARRPGRAPRSALGVEAPAARAGVAGLALDDRRAERLQPGEVAVEALDGQPLERRVALGALGAGTARSRGGARSRRSRGASSRRGGRASRAAAPPRRARGRARPPRGRPCRRRRRSPPASRGRYFSASLPWALKGSRLAGAVPHPQRGSRARSVRGLPRAPAKHPTTPRDPVEHRRGPLPPPLPRERHVRHGRVPGGPGPGGQARRGGPLRLLRRDPAPARREGRGRAGLARDQGRQAADGDPGLGASSTRPTTTRS